MDGQVEFNATAETAGNQVSATRGGQMKKRRTSQNETRQDKVFLFEIVESGELQGLKYQVIKTKRRGRRAILKSQTQSACAAMLKNNANTAKADIKG